jgi:ubiquinone/menaquinone biosynthesis C-methylase UbiE
VTPTVNVPTVNVLYIHGVVEALARFAPLLAEHTGWSYRLVANGCTPAEVALLHRVAAASDRLCVYELGNDTVLPHSETLCLLADTFVDEPFFAVMDSDVVVTGDITTQLSAALERHDAVFTGSTIWARPEDTVLRAGQPKACGPHERTEGGIVLGTSYFAVYHRPVFDEVRRCCRVGPGKYRRAWLVDLTSDFRDYLTSNDLLFADYTPPKVLNLAYAYTGHSVTNVASDDVHHIGGYSLATLHQQPAQADLTEVAGMIDPVDVRPHTARKIAVCDRLLRSFTTIDTTGTPWREQTFDPPLEQRIQLLEDLYARQAHLVTRLTRLPLARQAPVDTERPRPMSATTTSPARSTPASPTPASSAPWDASARAYDQHTRRYPTHDQITTTLALLAGEDTRTVLDFGCGPGNSTRLLSRRLPHATIVGVDSSAAMIDLARTTTTDATIDYRHTDLTDSTATDPHLDDRRFDLIACANSLFHVTDKPALLDRFSSLLGPTGRVVFSLYDTVFRPDEPLVWPLRAEPDDTLMQLLLAQLRERGHTITARGEDREILTETRLAALFSAAGLRVRCGTVLRLRRTADERLSFFSVPATAAEVFPGLPAAEVAAAAADLRDRLHDQLEGQLRGPDVQLPEQERCVYAFAATRT